MTAFEFDHKLHTMLMDIKAEPDREKRKAMIRNVCDYLKSKNQHLAYLNELIDNP